MQVTQRNNAGGIPRGCRAANAIGPLCLAVPSFFSGNIFYCYLGLARTHTAAANDRTSTPPSPPPLACHHHISTIASALLRPPASPPSPASPPPHRSTARSRGIYEHLRSKLSTTTTTTTTQRDSKYSPRPSSSPLLYLPVPFHLSLSIYLSVCLPPSLRPAQFSTPSYSFRG